MVKMKVYYFVTVSSGKTESEVFDEYPDELVYNIKDKKIKLIKDTIEVVSEDIEYGEG